MFSAIERLRPTSNRTAGPDLRLGPDIRFWAEISGGEGLSVFGAALTLKMSAKGSLAAD
jgi:hypothetical protein